jgi:hypothetical protein
MKRLIEILDSKKNHSVIFSKNIVSHFDLRMSEFSTDFILIIILKFSGHKVELSFNSKSDAMEWIKGFMEADEINEVFTRQPKRLWTRSSYWDNKNNGLGCREIKLLARAEIEYEGDEKKIIGKSRSYIRNFRGVGKKTIENLEKWFFFGFGIFYDEKNNIYKIQNLDKN